MIQIIDNEMHEITLTRNYILKIADKANKTLLDDHQIEIVSL